MDPQITQAIAQAKAALDELDAPQEPWLRDLEGSASLRPRPRIHADPAAMERRAPRFHLADDSATAHPDTGMSRVILGLAREMETAEAARSLAALEPRSGVRPMDLVLPASVDAPLDSLPPWELWRLELGD
jgi:hypothetical protein